VPKWQQNQYLAVNEAVWGWRNGGKGRKGGTEEKAERRKRRNGGKG